jgi:hypothetical protein
MSVLDPDFDPLRIMQELNANQVSLNNNYLKMVQAHNNLALKVEQQQLEIDRLMLNLDNANKANELLLKGLVNDIQSQLKL